MPWDPLNTLPKARHWLWLALALLVLVTQGPAFVGSLKPDRSTLVDFFQDWSSANNLLHGAPVYGSLAQAMEQYLGLRVRDPEHLTLNVNGHPPTSILLVTPLATLDYPDAVLVWNLLSLAALGVSLWIVQRQLRIECSVWSLLPILSLLLLCGPLRHHTHLGQFSLLLLLLLTGTWAAARTGRLGCAGVLLGVATTVKLFPAFLFLYFLTRCQWRAVVMGLLTFALLTGATLAATGPAAGLTYAQEVLPSLRQYHSSWHNMSLAGYFNRLFDPYIPPKPSHVSVPAPGEVSGAAAEDAGGGSDVVDRMEVYPTVPMWRNQLLARAGIVLSCSVVTVLCVWASWRSRSLAQSDRAFALSLVGMLLVSPITWDHYLLILLFPWVLVWVALPVSALARGLFLVLSATLWTFPPIVWSIWLSAVPVNHRPTWETATPLHTLTILSLHCYALLSLFAFLFVLWKKAPSVDAGVSGGTGSSGLATPPTLRLAPVNVKPARSIG
jgi:Glycosyltransferase family 87